MPFFIILIGSFYLFGCATNERRAFDPSLCQEAISYQSGFNDGRDGSVMDSSYAYRCREDLRANAFKGYKEGYDKGYSEYQKMLEENRRQFEQSRRAGTPEAVPPITNPLPPQIVIFGGDSPFSQPRRTARTWYCKVTSFGSTFDAFGSTRIEAERAARRSCQTQNHEMHCNDVNCEQNI